jgi:hypothetical protein
MSCSERAKDTRAGDQRLFTPPVAAPMLVSRLGGAMAGESVLECRGVSLLLGLGLGALGGCMVPLEVFSPVMQRVAHATPQAWATTPSPGSSATARPSPASCRSWASSRPMPPCC